MRTEPLRVAVIGLSMGQWHVENFLSIPNAKVVAICDRDEKWMNHLNQKWNIAKTYVDYADLLQDPEIEAVAVCLPTFLHLSCTLDALNANKHVLLEKPMALNADEGLQMKSLALKQGKTLMLSLNQRYDADVQFLKRFVSAGNIGDVYFARTLWRRPLGSLPNPIADRPSGIYSGRNWFNEATKGGGALRDLGAHVIDVALWLMGYPEFLDACGATYCMFLPEFLNGTGFVGDAEDHAVGFARFKNGASMQIEVSFGQHIDHDEIITELFGAKGGVLRCAGQPPKIFSKAGEAYCTTIPRIQEPKRNTQMEFTEAILEERLPAISADHGIQVLRIMDAIYRK